MNIILSKNNLSHIYNKHGITELQILSILNNADVVTKTSINVKYYYKDNYVVIVTRPNKNKEWYLKTAYQDTLRGYILGKIIYQKEVI